MSMFLYFAHSKVLLVNAHAHEGNASTGSERGHILISPTI
jgi:hypothetical protein